jgi:hypothetical protein
MDKTIQQESLETPTVVEVKVDNIILDDKNVTLNVTSRSKLFTSVKTNMSFVYNKFMKLVTCATNSVDTTYEPSTHEPRRHHIEKLNNMKEPVKEDETLVVIEQQLVVEEAVASLVPVEPVVVEQPVSIEERM